MPFGGLIQLKSTNSEQHPLLTIIKLAEILISYTKMSYVE